MCPGRVVACFGGVLRGFVVILGLVEGGDINCVWGDFGLG